jgi:hypothetical protein
MKFQSLLEKKFRQGQGYKLTEWNRLDNSKKESVASLPDESEVYGVFEPIISTQKSSYRVAYQQVALLYFHLQQSNKLPHYLMLPQDPKVNETIAALLLDGIIEIEWEGRFVSGPGALPVLYNDEMTGDAQLPTYLSQLSYKAIYYAWMLKDVNEKCTTARLYTFNTTPWDASLKMAFQKKNTVKEFLLSRIDHNALKTLNARWQPTEKTEWLSWNRKVTEPLTDGQSNVYKLYISPLINDLPEVLLECIPVIDSSDAISFKIGNTLQGLLRPDKMVVYFYSRDSLFTTAGILIQFLKGFAPQGVPFSAQLDDNGLLSWGKDPPGDGSWRTAVSEKLAAILQHAKENQLNWPLTISYIDATMQSKGLDIRNWEPTYQFNG